MNPVPVVGPSQLVAPPQPNPVTAASTASAIDFGERVKRQRLNQPNSVTDAQLIAAVNFSEAAVSNFSNANAPQWAVAMEARLTDLITREAALSYNASVLSLNNAVRRVGNVTNFNFPATAAGINALSATQLNVYQANNPGLVWSANNLSVVQKRIEFLRFIGVREGLVLSTDST